METLALFTVLVASSLQAGQMKPPPKEADEPFAIYVFTEVPGDPDDGDSIGRTTEEVEKKIGDRKKWFRTVETREEADIVVEVLDQASEQSTKQNLVTRTENTDAPDQQIAVFADIKDSYTLLARVYVPKGHPLDMKVDAEGRRPRDAAKPFALRLEMFVRQNYWTLMEALER